MPKNINYAHGKQKLPDFIPFTPEVLEEDGVTVKVEESNQSFVWCNFSQTIPHTKIGDDGVIFRKCNLHNCDLAEGVILEDCSQVGRYVSWCSHKVKFSDLPECEEECEHSTKHTVEQDDEDDLVFYTYEDHVEVE